MASLGGLFVLVYDVLRLLGRFVSAHERVANALEIVARKMQENGKQL